MGVCSVPLPALLHRATPSALKGTVVESGRDKKRKNLIIITTWWSPRRIGVYVGGSRPIFKEWLLCLAAGGCPSGL